MGGRSLFSSTHLLHEERTWRAGGTGGVKVMGWNKEAGAVAVVVRQRGEGRREYKDQEVAMKARRPNY
ncbi:hypothetical protein E2C01_047880 [Portunus trituberculatus]|uniref:Uncharacterized protein n=1 Tax=Portunus trituberculatus TaxID=210409 RepID=A0A5B7G921_PORTR|nr:hypothetical protein [Portunus trituberculatus]